MSCLPQELINAIINQIDIDDHPTLKTCSLIAWPFVHPSQKSLFHTIELTGLKTRKGSYTRFLRLLTLKPHLGTYVRSLRIGDYADDSGSSRSWIIQAQNMPELFQLLPLLESFSLTFNSDEMNWKSIPAEIRAALGRLFRLPTLQTVSLEFIRGFPAQLLFGLTTALDQLSLSCVEVDFSHGHHSHHSASKLRGLHLRGTPPPTIAALSQCLPESIPTLRRLAITPTLEPGFCDAIRELMAAVGSNITHFEWLPSIHFCTSFFFFFFFNVLDPP